METILRRLTEPSTYAGIAAFAASLGIFGFGEGEWNTIFGAVALIAAAVAGSLPEKSQTVIVRQPRP